MKKAIATALLFFAAFACRAQIQMAGNENWETIGQIKRLGTTIAKLEYRTEGSDTLYFLLMKDFTKQRETNYFSIKFRGTGNTFGTLYNLLMSFFNEENSANKNYMQTFTLGQTGVNLQHVSLIAQHGVRLTTKEGYVNLSEKDIGKLFGKR